MYVVPSEYRASPWLSDDRTAAATALRSKPVALAIRFLDDVELLKAVSRALRAPKALFV